MTEEEKEYNDKKYKIKNLKKMATDKEKDKEIEIEIDEFKTEDTVTTNIPVTNIKKKIMKIWKC